MKEALAEAAAWYARLQSPDCRPEEQAQFKRWLEQDQNHAAAYAAAERLAHNLTAQAPHNAKLLAMAEEALAMGTAVDPRSIANSRPRQSRWQKWVPLATAASFVLGVFVVLNQASFTADPAQLASFTTVAGEQRSLTFDDGTVTRLDVNSAVTVAVSDTARDVNLVKGRAIFDVAHDSRRPFSVAVGSSRIIALGTRFQVQRNGPAVIVTLEEGSVEVVSEFEGETRRERLKPGEQLRLAQMGAAWIKTTIETDTATSWSRGRHVFRDSKLTDALDEVNRYAQRKIRLGDPALADMAVSGNFVIGDSHKVVAAFEAALPLRVVDGGSELVLFPVYGRNDNAGPASTR